MKDVDPSVGVAPDLLDSALAVDCEVGSVGERGLFPEIAATLGGDLVCLVGGSSLSHLRLMP